MARPRKNGKDKDTAQPGTFTGVLNVQSDDGPKTYTFENGVLKEVVDAEPDDYNPTAEELRDEQELDEAVRQERERQLHNAHNNLRMMESEFQALKEQRSALAHGLMAERMDLKARLYRIDIRLKALAVLPPAVDSEVR